MLLAKMCGYQDLNQFSPFWCQLQPPECLTSLVLPAFKSAKAELEEVLQVNASACSVTWVCSENEGVKDVRGRMGGCHIGRLGGT